MSDVHPSMVPDSKVQFPHPPQEAPNEYPTHAQFPVWQIMSWPQTLAQLPQWLGSLPFTLVHPLVPPQSKVPVGHRHEPPEHTLPVDEHEVQLVLVPQESLVFAHTQVPPEQRFPLPQALPQPPQLLLSLLVSTQPAVPQSVPEPQTHAPLASHVFPDGHVPQVNVPPQPLEGEPQTRVPQVASVQQLPLKHVCPASQQLDPHTVCAAEHPEAHAVPALLHPVEGQVLVGWTAGHVPLLHVAWSCSMPSVQLCAGPHGVVLGLLPLTLQIGSPVVQEMA